MKEIGKRIRELRKEEGVTQATFAKRVLVSQSYLSGIENGNEIPTDKMIKLICLEFGINENWLRYGTGEMYSVLYEVDKEELMNQSNEALLKMMQLLSTESNVEYSKYASSFACLTGLLSLGQRLDESKRIEFLELVDTLSMDLERFAYVVLASKEINNETMLAHTSGLNEDLKGIINFLWSEAAPKG